MRVLIACEFSGVVRDAFIRAGHDAWSVDLLESKAPGPHYTCDARAPAYWHGWDLMIAHPPCTYLSSSGLHWNNRGRGHENTKIALQFVRDLMAAPIPRICIENPQGCIGTRIRPADQYIQPYQFGADASKKTGLWLKNLPPLRPTAFVEPRLVCCGAEVPNRDKYGCPNCCGDKVARPRWANQTDSGQNRLGPSADRWALRSETYPGIAEAMAAQWGGKALQVAA